MTVQLEVNDVTVHFGGVSALEGVSFTVATGELLSLIGPNGAGKTTLIRGITGVVRPQQGRIYRSGREITHLPIHRRTRMGLAMTHQIVRPFHTMTVLDNVTLAAGHARTRNAFRAMLAFRRSSARRNALALLERVGIAAVADKPVTGQPLGVLKRLEVARALALDPGLLLLDEPLAGLNSHEAATLADTVVAINREGMTVVMIEHNLGEVLRVSQRLVVLDNGFKIGDGRPGEVMRDPKVRSAYVGKEGSRAATGTA